MNRWTRRAGFPGSTTARFIDQNVGPSCIFADVGCGTGIFTVAALKRGAQVLAIDFSESALRITEENVKRHATGNVTYVQLDAQTGPIPRCDIALSMGVTPYVTDLESFLRNILASTRQLFFCQYTDPERLSNRVRTILPILNVRNLVFHSRAKVDGIYSKFGWVVKERRNFATGFIDTIVPARQLDEKR